MNDPVNLIDPEGEMSSLPQWLVAGAAGFGDALSFGGADWIRDQLGTNNVVDKCSGFYGGGKYAGYACPAAIGGTGLARGYKAGAEITLGRSFRIAPFGNRIRRPTGRHPHYHRRGVDSTGQTLPAQAIGRPALGFPID